MLKHAIAAQQRGFHIFPVARNGKVPHPAASWVDSSGTLHGWGETATNDINQIVTFWTHFDPQANIGVACKPSQLLVVDLDIAKEDWKLRDTEYSHLHAVYGPRVSGEDVFDEMMWQRAGAGQRSALDTYSVLTRSGGLHLYYRWPSHWPKISQASPVKGIVDVRGNGGQYGGYVLGEGSQVDGAGYRNVDSGRYNIELPPEWIRLLVAEKPKPPKISRPGGLMQPGVISWSGLVESVQNAGEGNRNNALVWAARTMCEEGATVAQALEALGPAASSAGLGDMEIERTIESAYRTQQYKERS